LGKAYTYLSSMTGTIPLRTMALFEIEMQQETFSNMTQCCFNKCFPVMNQPGMTPNETDCVDRCISKYLLTTTEIMKQGMQAQMAVQNAEQQAFEQMQQASKGRGLGGLLGGKVR